MITGKQKAVLNYIKELESRGKLPSASMVATHYDIPLRRALGYLEKLQKANLIEKDNFIYKSK